MKFTARQEEILNTMANGADIWVDSEYNWRLGGEPESLSFDDVRRLEREGAIRDLGIGVFQITPSGLEAVSAPGDFDDQPLSPPTGY